MTDTQRYRGQQDQQRNPHAHARIGIKATIRFTEPDDKRCDNYSNIVYRIPNQMYQHTKDAQIMPFYSRDWLSLVIVLIMYAVDLPNENKRSDIII
jgi:hypothetical protein